MQRNILILICTFFLFMNMLNASENVKPEKILLWPDGAPGALGDTDKDKPGIYFYPAPEKTNTGAAVVICPGGGYVMTSMDYEGHDFARFFNSFGVNAIVLDYRFGSHTVKSYRHPIPFMDATRAMRYVRFKAKEWHIDPERIGIMGFSAGGHLASTVGTHFDYGQPDSKDPIEKQTSRPNFMILAYPVISFTTEFTHRGSRQALLSRNPDPELVKSLSNETQVTTLTPPTFLVHTTDDRSVPVENSILFYQALRKARVPAEMHIYLSGPHGFGLAGNLPVLSTWTDRLKDWMKSMTFISESAK